MTNMLINRNKTLRSFIKFIKAIYMPKNQQLNQFENNL